MMSFSHNPHPAPHVPLLPQRHPPQILSSPILGSHEPHYPAGNGRRFSRDNLSPDDLTLKVLSDKAREVRITLHSPPENLLTPFFQDVPWTRENPRIVHGAIPTIDCAGFFQRCHLCIQHSLSRSLPAAVRQKYLKHDHTYMSKQSEGELPLVTRVALDLIERNYSDAYTKMISIAGERTNPPRMFSRPTEFKRIVRELRSSRMNVEDMEKILTSPYAKFDEVEIHSSQTLSAMITSDKPAIQPPLTSTSSGETAGDGASALVDQRSCENLNSKTNVLIEKGFPHWKPGSSEVSTGCSSAKSAWNGQSKTAFTSVAEFVAEPRQQRLKCACTQTESIPVRERRDLVSHDNTIDRYGLQAMHEHPGIGHTSRVPGRDSLHLASNHMRGPDLETREPRQGCDILMTAGTSNNFSFKRRSSCDATDRELNENRRLKRRCLDDIPRLSSDSGLKRASVFRPAPTWSPIKPKVPCACCTEGPATRSTQRNPPMQVVGAPVCFDRQNHPVCKKYCCLSLKMGERRLPEYAPRSHVERFNEVLPSNRISAKCPTCGIIFRTVGIAKSMPCVVSSSSPLGLLREHMTLHRPNILNCVFPSCREKKFDKKDDLIAHMDAHRQGLISAGVERWENLEAVPLPLTRVSKPNLTCEICLIDFNWRTTLPGMLTHTERYIRHCEQHRSKMGEEDYCIWQCVLRDCKTKFSSQPLLEEHMWTVHAVLCHCSTCDWIVWGDTDEVCLHREKCTAQLTDVDLKQFAMKSSTKNAPKPSTSASANTKCLGTPAKSSRSVSYPSSPRLRRRSKPFRSRAVKSGKPTPAKLDTASSANHLMRFSYYCDYCGAPFRSHHQKQYQSHVQDHLPDKQLTCVYNDCGRKFASLQELHTHVKTKLSTCRYCGDVQFSDYKKHILTCRPLHEIKKQRLLKEEFAKVRYAPMKMEGLYWSNQRLCRSDPGVEQTADVPEADGQECFLRSLNLVKGSSETIKAKTRRHEQLRSQIHVANGKGRRACTEKTACAKCGRIFRNALNLREHLRGYHNARDF